MDIEFNIPVDRIKELDTFIKSESNTVKLKENPLFTSVGETLKISLSLSVEDSKKLDILRINWER